MVFAAGGQRPVVVKLGGSLAYSPELDDWLSTALDHPGRAVLVPGGGSFADQVRNLQDRWGIDDAAAHGLAIAGMELFGRFLVALRPGLVSFEDDEELARALTLPAVALWLPSRMTHGQPDIPENWDTTSDSLAVWLAGRIGACRLVLAKSASRPHGTATAEELSQAGLLDPAFPAFLARAGVETWYLGPGQMPHLHRAFSDREPPEGALVGVG